MTVLPIKHFTERFKLQLMGQVVPVPYWINWSVEPYFLNSPYRGKGYPGQIERATRHALKKANAASMTRQELRAFMRRHGLGVDCSGFVYRVLDAYLRQYGRSIAEGLVVRPEELVEAARLHPNRPTLNVQTPVSLSEVARVWHKDPAMITSVKRLIDPLISKRITHAGHIRAGDVISMTSVAGDHIAVVTEVAPGFIEYAASEDRMDDDGGLHYRVITMVDPAKGLEDQTWDQAGIFNPTKYGNGVHRLNIMAAVTTDAK